MSKRGTGSVKGMGNPRVENVELGRGCNNPLFKPSRKSSPVDSPKGNTAIRREDGPLESRELLSMAALLRRVAEGETGTDIRREAQRSIAVRSYFTSLANYGGDGESGGGSRRWCVCIHRLVREEQCVVINLSTNIMCLIQFCLTCM